jgi:hypothetical protein
MVAGAHGGDSEEAAVGELAIVDEAEVIVPYRRGAVGRGAGSAVFRPS